MANGLTVTGIVIASIKLVLLREMTKPFKLIVVTVIGCHFLSFKEQPQTPRNTLKSARLNDTVLLSL